MHTSSAATEHCAGSQQGATAHELRGRVGGLRGKACVSLAPFFPLPFIPTYIHAYTETYKTLVSLMLLFAVQSYAVATVA